MVEKVSPIDFNWLYTLPHGKNERDFALLLVLGAIAGALGLQ